MRSSFCCPRLAHSLDQFFRGVNNFLCLPGAKRRHIDKVRSHPKSKCTGGKLSGGDEEIHTGGGNKFHARKRCLRSFVVFCAAHFSTEKNLDPPRTFERRHHQFRGRKVGKPHVPIPS